MRLFCPECGKQLMLEHSIKIDLVSNFTFCDGTLTLTKHQIRNSENIRQKLTLEKIEGMLCTTCAKTFTDVEKTLCQCDECGNKLMVKDIQPIGETIILCGGCLSRYRHFKDFKIFGLRGPDRKTRKKRYNKTIEEVNAIRDFPEEIQQIYTEALGDNSDASPFEDEEERLIEELMRDESIISPPTFVPQEVTITPDVTIRTDTNVWQQWSSGSGRFSSGTSSSTDGE